MRAPKTTIGQPPSGRRTAQRGRRRGLGEEGTALVIALVLLLGVAAMAAGAIILSATDLVVAGNERRHTAALDVAEAGVSEALFRMSQRPGTVLNVGGSNIDVSISDPADPPDPNWRARIYLTSPLAAPAPQAGEISTGTIQQAGSYLEYADPSDPAGALVIQHKLRDFNGDGIDEVVLYDAAKIPPENPTSGFPMEQILVTGHRGNAQRRVIVEATRFPLNPNVLAALSSDAGVDLRGNVSVCGHNHRMDTPPGTRLPDCSPAWDETSDHLVAVMTTGDDVLRKGSTDLMGTPALLDTASTNTFYGLAQALGVTQEELDDVLSHAEHTSADDPPPLQGITYIQGDAKLTSVTGEGLLYITGDCEIAGGFEWVGLVYVLGDLTLTGNAWILGGVMVEGDSQVAVDFGAGSPAILYSREALMRALTSGMPYVQMAWKEQ